MTNEEMAAALRKAGWRVSEPLTPKNCKHPRKQGRGQIGSDGSSKLSWYCPDCHASDSFETPPNPDLPKWQSWW
jgi:hypothetical protein